MLLTMGTQSETLLEVLDAADDAEDDARQTLAAWAAAWRAGTMSNASSSVWMTFTDLAAKVAVAGHILGRAVGGKGLPASVQGIM